MKTYQYSGFSTDGRAVKGLIEAESLKDSREKLAARGILAESVTASDRSVRIKPAARASVYRELSELLSAGLPVDRALDTMLQASDSSGRSVFLARIKDGIREGGRLSAAFAAGGASVGRFELAMLESAEQTAALELMLLRLADFLEEAEDLRERIQTLLIYPMLLLTLGTCAGIVMLGWLLPRTISTIGIDTGKLPLITRLMMGFGGVFSLWGLLAAALVAAAVFYILRRARHDDSLSTAIDRAMFRVPLIGGGYKILVCQRFSRTMSMLLEGGVSVIDAVILAGRATGSRWISGICEERAEEIRHGSRTSDAIRRVPYLSESIAEWIAVGEAAGGLVRMTASAGARYTRLWDRYIARAMGLLEPAVLIFVGGFVLVVALAVLLPLTSLTRLMGL